MTKIHWVNDEPGPMKSPVDGSTTGLCAVSLCTLSDFQNEPCTHFWQGNLATGTLLRTVSVHMLAIVQMEWRAQSLSSSRADETHLPGADLVRPLGIERLGIERSGI
jgi:hypothetical protein